MSDPNPPPSPVSIPWGFLGMLVLVLAAEGFAARHEDDLFLRIDHWNWRNTGRLAETAAPDSPIVCLGDSMMQVGIASPILHDRTGRAACNLAISGGQAASSYFLFRRVLETGAVPDAVLVDFFPELLQASPLGVVDPWAVLARTSECADLAWTAGDPGFLARTMLARLVPTIRARGAIRDSLGAALRGESAVDRHVVPPSLVRNLRVNGGGVLCPPKAARGEDLEAWSRQHFSPAWTCHPVNEAYLRRLLELAGTRGIPVFWVLPPLDPALQARCEASGFDARHGAFVRAMVAEYPDVHVIDGRYADYDRAVFHDPHHLARSGAAVFSTEVAAVVRRVLEQPRTRPLWVALPRYRAAPGGVPLEDLDQSRLAVRDARTKPRR